MHGLIETCSDMVCSDKTRILTISGADLTTFSLGGPVSCYIETASLGDLSHIRKRLAMSNINIRPIGNGSNIVLPDEGISSEPVLKFIPLGIRLRLLDGKEIHVSEDPVFKDSVDQKASLEFKELLSDMTVSQATMKTYAFRVHAGASLMSVCRMMTSAGFHGLEFAAGIPGTIGGAVIMNAGAHGNEISSVISRVHCLNEQGLVETLESSGIEFVYRKTSIPPNHIVIAVDMELKHCDPAEVRRNREEALAYRKRTQPLTFPSAGSVFKNPEGRNESAGAILEELGLKGYCRGGVVVSDIHANWIVKQSKNAFSREVLALVEFARNKALTERGVTLHPEILFWGS